MLNDILQERPEYYRGGFGILILVIDKWLIKMPLLKKNAVKVTVVKRRKNRNLDSIFN